MQAPPSKQGAKVMYRIGKCFGCVNTKWGISTISSGDMGPDQEGNLYGRLKRTFSVVMSRMQRI